MRFSRKYYYSGMGIKSFFVMALILASVWGWVLYLQKSHFREAEEHVRQARWKLAIREYDTTIHFYTPFSPYIRLSALRLWEMGEQFEREGKPDRANIAYSAIRSSFYSARSFYTPGKDWIERCDEKIATLNVMLLVRDGSVKPPDIETERKKQLYLLKTDKSPEPFWIIMVIAGFAGWVSSVIFIIFKGFDESGNIDRKKVLCGTVSFVFAFALWISAMLKA